MSRVIFTLQLVWLTVLVPGLIAGARMHGISGVALAELAVAAAVPLPWYLVELCRAGSKGRVLAARLGLPLAGALLAGLAAAVAAAVVPRALTALFCGALAGLLVIGVLLLRMRGTLGSLLKRYTQAGKQDERNERNEQEGLAVRAEPVLAVSAPLVPSVPGSLLSGLDITRSFAAQDAADAETPLYRATVDFLHWDPCAGGKRTRSPLRPGPGRITSLTWWRFIIHWQRQSGGRACALVW